MIKGPFSYSGNKWRIWNGYLSQVLTKYDKIHEPFLGSGVCLYNSKLGGTGIDIDPAVVALHNSLLDSNLVEKIESTWIKYFGDGLGDKDSFLKLRADFNEEWKVVGLTVDNIASLWILTQLAFNSLLRFGPNGYNVPYGEKRFDLDRIKEHAKIRRDLDIRIKLGSFQDLDLNSISKERDIIYLDPPYVASKFQYGGWNKENEIQLLEWISELNNQGFKFILSNTFLHRGETNDDLIEWAKNFNTYFIKMSYNAWASRVKAVEKETGTVEVIITNLDGEFKTLEMAN
jgi:DNA adenine methylase